MQILRTIVDSDRLKNILEIPYDLKNQKVEVVIRPLPKRRPKKKKVFNPASFEGVLKLDTLTIEMETRRMRDEWERM